jgi:RNA-directed DNA polymerase
MFFIDKLLEESNKSQNDLIEYALNSHKRYRRYEIKKKTGGLRTIHHPSKELKLYQKFISNLIFLKLPVHESVFSYRKKVSILNLANEHKENKYLLRIDFKDFFPSIQGENIRLFLNKNKKLLDNKLSDLDITLINLLVCKKGKITIGAPSSPAISNTILYDFDKEIYDKCEHKNIKYSRYADDLYFSTNESNQLSEILKYLQNYTFPFNLKLKINQQKNLFTSKKHRRLITGLTITTDGKVTVGRKQKSYIKSLINKYKKINIDETEKKYLKGYLSFLISIEPEYIELLKNKYSEETINELLLNSAKYSNK